MRVSLKKPLAAALIGALALSPMAALAQDASAAIAARKGQFNILALNMGVLGGMARGNAPYDAAAAQTAADNIAAIASVAQNFHWPEGSDAMSVDGTRALPAIWENTADFTAKWGALGDAAGGLQAAAGTSLEAMQAAIGPVGGTCGACHDAYRAPQ